MKKISILIVSLVLAWASPLSLWARATRGSLPDNRALARLGDPDIHFVRWGRTSVRVDSIQSKSAPFTAKNFVPYKPGYQEGAENRTNIAASKKAPDRSDALLDASEFQLYSSRKILGKCPDLNALHSSNDRNPSSIRPPPIS